MKILHRYVLKEHIGPLLFALTALTSMLLLQYIAKRFGELVGKGLPWQVIAEFLFLSLPLTIALSLPMAVLVSTLYAFSRLASENEITAMKAGGISLRAVMRPVLVAAAGVTLFMLAFNDQVLPRANHRLRTLQGDIAQKKPTFGLREQVINEVSPGKLYLRAGHLAKTSNRMREVTIYDMGDPTRRRTIYADSGNMVMTRDQEDLQLTLYSGEVREVPTATPEQLQRLYFEQELVKVRGVGNEFRKTTNDTYKGEREMSVCEMERNAERARLAFDSAHRDFERLMQQARRRNVKVSDEVLRTRRSEPVSLRIGSAYCTLLEEVPVAQLTAQEPPPPPPSSRATEVRRGAPPGLRSAREAMGKTRPAPVAAQSRVHTQLAPPTDSVPDAALPSRLEGARLRLDDARNSVNLYEVEIHKKFSLAAACFVFVLLGAPIALRFPRGGVGLVLAVSIVVFALYYVGLIGGEALSRKGYIPPFLSMWGANIIFTVLALFLLARMGRESATSRGGDLRELLATLRDWMRKPRAPASTIKTQAS